jgi:hypothetical protein
MPASHNFQEEKTVCMSKTQKISATCGGTLLSLIFTLSCFVLTCFPFVTAASAQSKPQVTPSQPAGLLTEGTPQGFSAVQAAGDTVTHAAIDPATHRPARQAVR